MAQSPKKIRLMLVDDHEVVRRGLRAIFAECAEIEVVGEAGSVADAIAQATKTSPDVVLMDMRLPDGTGLDACREIRANNASVRVLFLTSYSDADAVTATVLACAGDYLLKEIRRQPLLDAVVRVAAGQSILDPALIDAALKEVGVLAKNAGGARDRRHLLSAHERRILSFVVEGKTNKEIATAMGLSNRTIKNYLHNAFQKLRVRRRAEAAIAYMRLGEENRSGTDALTSLPASMEN